MKDAQRTLGHQAALLQEVAITLSLVIPSTYSWAVGVNTSHCLPLKSRQPTGQALVQTAWVQIGPQGLTSFSLGHSAHDNKKYPHPRSY